MSIVTYIPVVLSGFPTKLLYAYVNSPVHSTCPIHRIPFDFMTLIIFRKNSTNYEITDCTIASSLLMLSLIGNSEKSVDISRSCIALLNMLTFYVKLLSRVKHPS